MAGAFNLSDFVCILAFSIVHPSSSVLGFCQNRSHLQKQIPMCLLLSLASFLLLPGNSLICNRMSRIFIALKAYRVIPINVILLFFNMMLHIHPVFPALKFGSAGKVIDGKTGNGPVGILIICSRL